MTKTRITPFLILNPLIAIWAIYRLVVVQLNGGFAVIMSGFFVTVVAVSFTLLVIDRLLPRQINLWVVSVIEIFTLITLYRLAEWYWSG
jgi:hypothetical protein